MKENSKKYQKAFNLNWLDYGAGNYDPQLGRWLQVDPADEFNSPYVYCGNNPIIFVDGNGESIFYFQFEGREAFGLGAPWGGIGLTHSDAIGIAVDLNGDIGVFYSTSLGVSIGTPIAYSGSATLGYLTLDHIADMNGLGYNIGVMSPCLNGEFDVSTDDNAPSGVGPAIPLLGQLIGISFYSEATYTWERPIATVSEMYDYLNDLFKSRNLSLEELGITQESLEKNYLQIRAMMEYGENHPFFDFENLDFNQVTDVDINGNNGPEE